LQLCGTAKAVPFQDRIIPILEREANLHCAFGASRRSRRHQAVFHDPSEAKVLNHFSAFEARLKSRLLQNYVRTPHSGKQLKVPPLGRE